MTKQSKHLSQALLFIMLFGIVSLFSDMTHEVLRVSAGRI